MPVSASKASSTTWKASPSAPPHSEVTLIVPSPSAPVPSPPSPLAAGPPSPSPSPSPVSPAGHAVSTNMRIMNGATNLNLDIEFLHLFHLCRGHSHDRYFRPLPWAWLR